MEVGGGAIQKKVITVGEGGGGGRGVKGALSSINRMSLFTSSLRDKIVVMSRGCAHF